MLHDTWCTVSPVKLPDAALTDVYRPCYITLAFIVVAIVGYAAYRATLQAVNKHRANQLSQMTPEQIALERGSSERYADKRFTFVYSLWPLHAHQLAYQAYRGAPLTKMKAIEPRNLCITPNGEAQNFHIRDFPTLSKLCTWGGSND
jgi:hypothetical protein